MAGIDDYSITAGSNATIAGTDIAENCAPSGINNALRQLLADIRRAFNDTAGKAVSSGTDAVTLTTETVYTAYADGMIIGAIIGGTNTGAATLSLDSVGAKAIRKGADVALVAGDQVAGMPAIWMYDASANGAAGAWLLLNPQTLSLDADLVSWAGVTRAAGFDTFVATPSSANLRSLLTDETGTGGAVFATSPTLTDPAITGAILEDIYTITDGAAFEIDPSNGTLQRVVLGASRTPAATNFANGESITLMVDDGTAYAITWSTVGVVWIGGSAPTLETSGWTVIELWKEGNVIRGVRVGAAAS